MNVWLLGIMKLQGELRMCLLRHGVLQEQSLEMSGDAIELVMASGIVDECYEEKWAEFKGGDDGMSRD